MEQRKELVTERHELPSRYWEPEPPENLEVELSEEDMAEMMELPFE